jgi:hypothetical protein
MFMPSGIRAPQGRKLRVETVRRGLFAVQNAYEGEYEYFRGRPILSLVLEPVEKPDVREPVEEQERE